MTDPTDQSAVNAVLLERTARFEKLLLGNGQPGLVQRVTENETSIVHLRSDMEAYVQEKVAEAKPSKPVAAGGLVAGVSALLAALIPKINEMLTK